MSRRRVEVGSIWGRWEVVRRAAPAQRYREPGTRARVLVRCVCGLEQLVFVCDLQSRKTRGCTSLRCRMRWETRRELIELLSR